MTYNFLLIENPQNNHSMKEIQNIKKNYDGIHIGSIYNYEFNSIVTSENIHQYTNFTDDNALIINNIWLVIETMTNDYTKIIGTSVSNNLDDIGSLVFMFKNYDVDEIKRKIMKSIKNIIITPIFTPKSLNIISQQNLLPSYSTIAFIVVKRDTIIIPSEIKQGHLHEINHKLLKTINISKEINNALIKITSSDKMLETRELWLFYAPIKSFDSYNENNTNDRESKRNYSIEFMKKCLFNKNDYVKIKRPYVRCILINKEISFYFNE